MARCNNCKKGLSCGCQKRKANDGTSVCRSCVTAYNHKLKASGNYVRPKVQAKSKGL